MKQIPFLDQVFAPLYGLPCWHVQPGYGQILTLEFGQPHLEVHEPTNRPARTARLRRLYARRTVVVHGAWHLWIYCCDWCVLVRGKVVGDNTSTRRCRRAAQELDGQALISVSLDLDTMRTRFLFDLGASLETTPFDDTGEQWMLYEPSGMVLAVRADRQFLHAEAVTLPDQQKWQPLR